VDIKGVLRRLILDTGSNVSMLQPGISGRDIRVTPKKPYGVTGEVLDIRGLQSVPLTLNGCEFTQEFLVCTLPTGAAGLLGTDFMESVGAGIDFECNKMSFASTGKVPLASKEAKVKHTALTVFTEGKAGRSSQLNRQETRRRDEQLSAGLRTEDASQNSRTWLVRAKENVVVVPRCRQIIEGEKTPFTHLCGTRPHTDRGNDPSESAYSSRGDPARTFPGKFKG
jgi:hypothetical protein